MAVVMMLALGSMPATAQSVAGTAQARAHVYCARADEHFLARHG